MPSLFPRDAVLSLRPCGYSWALQRLAVMFCRSGSYEQGHEFVLAAAGVSVGRRQAEQIAAAAADAERFYQDRPCQEMLPAGTGEPGVLPPLGLPADGKGAAMRPGARRRRAKAPGKRARNFRKRTGTGEKKGCKRMAGTGCVFDVIAPDGPPRTPEGIMTREPGEPARGPRAVNRWYACDITAGRDVTIGKVFDEAERRDPDHRRAWIALAGGDVCQLDRIRAQAAARGVTITIVIDFIHVIEYLRKAAWCFHPPRDPVMEDWVIIQGPDILGGRVAEVTSRIRQLAANHPPQRSEHAKITSATLSCRENKQPFMDYPAALANGWPIATGVIEGACRHLVQDRMGITGARWGLQGAQSMLWLRATAASSDHDAYRTWHIQQEHQRNHLSRYHDSLALAA